MAELFGGEFLGQDEGAGELHGRFVDREVVDAAVQCASCDIAIRLKGLGEDIDVVLGFVAGDEDHGSYKVTRSTPLLGYFEGGFAF